MNDQLKAAIESNDVFLKNVTLTQAAKAFDEIRTALGDYMDTEGCTCCEDGMGHDDAANRLADILGVARDANDTRNTFDAYRTKD
jgi:hypothetical protein